MRFRSDASRRIWPILIWARIVGRASSLFSAIFRRQLHQQVDHALKRGGVFLLEAYTPKQLELRTGGPSDTSLMMTKDILQTELADLALDRLEELERDVVEGSLHTGPAAVVQAVAVKAQRRFRVSSNRSSANHRVRYVESGGGESEGICRVCPPSPKPR